MEGKFPVFVIDRVNHGQVASGELPDVVIERDVDAEVDGEEAYKRSSSGHVFTNFLITNLRIFLPNITKYMSEKMEFCYQNCSDQL